MRNNETKHIRTISGLADIGALCQVNSVSIVKDFGLHGTLDTATHELAHKLVLWLEVMDLGRWLIRVSVVLNGRFCGVL